MGAKLRDQTPPNRIDIWASASSRIEKGRATCWASFVLPKLHGHCLIQPMKKLILCFTLVAFGFAVQAGETKSPKDQAPAAKTTATAAKSECSDAKKEAAACTSCCGSTGKTEVKKQTTTMLRSPKHAAEKSA